MSRPILILSPTEMEIAAFAEQASDCVVEICGIGMAETAASCAAAIAAHDPRMVILAGIAGTYADSEMTIGESMLVDRERIADMGAFGNGVFNEKFAKEYLCPYAESIKGFVKVGSNSVSACAAPYVCGSQTYKIENMEGAAFFALCSALGVPFLELRTISNSVGAPYLEWNIPLATTNLCKSLNRLLREIEA